MLKPWDWEVCVHCQGRISALLTLSKLAIWRACCGVLRFIMECEPKAARSWCLRNCEDWGLSPWSLWMVCWVTVMIPSDTAGHRVPLRQGVLGSKAKLMLPWDPQVKSAPRSLCLIIWALWNPQVRSYPPLPSRNRSVGSEGHLSCPKWSLQHNTVSLTAVSENEASV